jgi:integrase
VSGPGRPGESARSGAIGAKTINNSLIVLRVALGHALDDGLIARNPAASTGGARERIKVAVQQPTMDFLRLSEIPVYLEACSVTYRPLAELLIACGLRMSEALELTWSHVDFEGAVLLVTASRKPGRGPADVSGSTKGDRFRGVEFGPRIGKFFKTCAPARASRERRTRAPRWCSWAER